MFERVSNSRELGGGIRGELKSNSREFKGVEGVSELERVQESCKQVEEAELEEGGGGLEAGDGWVKLKGAELESWRLEFIVCLRGLRIRGCCVWGRGS